MQHLFIINPHAGKRDATAAIYAMAERLRRTHNLDCRCLLTQSPGHAITLARAAAEPGADIRLYACGGDGTAHEVANGIAGYANAAMTCIPIGTGNDLLKNFGEDLAKFSDAENLWDGDVFPLDLIQCGDRYCLTIACCGVDARVAADVHRFNSTPALSGRGSYLAAVAANLLARPVSQRWTVTLDGQVLTGEFALLAVCSGRYYGGGSTPVPQSRMDDGVLHSILVKKVGRLALVKLFPDYSAGRHERFAHLASVSTAADLRVRAEEGTLTYCLDGEVFHGREIHIHLADQRVNFFGPKGCDCNRTAL